MTAHEADNNVNDWPDTGVETLMDRAAARLHDGMTHATAALRQQARLLRLVEGGRTPHAAADDRTLTRSDTGR